MRVFAANDALSESYIATFLIAQSPIVCPGQWLNSNASIQTARKCSYQFVAPKSYQIVTTEYKNGNDAQNIVFGRFSIQAFTSAFAAVASIAFLILGQSWKEAIAPAVLSKKPPSEAPANWKRVMSA